MRVSGKIPKEMKVVTQVQSAVQDVLGQERGERRLVLAISGGIDSMVLLDAAFAVLRKGESNGRSGEVSGASSTDSATLLVATFDHGTGPAATAAAALVASTCKILGIPCIAGRAARVGRTEAEWRHARWTFLRSVARDHDATIVTAHTQTDQIETVFMRALRDAGPRGLAALYAESDILRPLLRITRDQVTQYAEARNITFVTDPSNFNTKYLRNRIRHDILPQIRAVQPEFESKLLTLAARAADWRAQMDRIAAKFTVMIDSINSVHVPRAQFSGYTEEALRALWPALAARVQIVMDWRGTRRLATFTIEGDPGQSIQLSGGIHVCLRRDVLIFRRDRSHA